MAPTTPTAPESGRDASWPNLRPFALPLPLFPGAPNVTPDFANECVTVTTYDADGRSHSQHFCIGEVWDMTKDANLCPQYRAALGNAADEVLDHLCDTLLDAHSVDMALRGPRLGAPL